MTDGLPKRGLFTSVPFNLAVVALLVGIIGLIAYGMLGHPGDFAAPAWTMILYVPVLSLALVVLVCFRVVSLVLQARSDSKYDAYGLDEE